MKSATFTRPRWAIVSTAVVATLAGVVMIPAPANASVSATWIQEQVDFILSKQVPSGAILGTGTKISPYFGNEAAIGLLEANTPASRAGALAWMEWYLGHLNASATNVPANSVFDYTYDPATHAETSTGDFDSVDSYASTTLNVAHAAWETGNTTLRNYVTANITSYEAIANILDYGGTAGVRIETGDQAGLTIAKPSYAIAFTMDNAEVYSGLNDFAQLESAMGRSTESTYYQGWAVTTQDAIISKLWNPANHNWDWAYANSSDTNVFYPQATAQLWPAMLGVVSPSDAKAVSAWGQFTASWPNWYSDAAPDAYPWTAVAYAGRIMGEGAEADSDLTAIRARYAPTFTTPTSCGVSVCGDWYDAEAGWFIRAGASMDNPVVPVTPATPATPVTPATPATPATRAMPATPATPVRGNASFAG